MAIDYGSKAIGVAISDELRLTVRPLATLRIKRFKYPQILEEISSMVAENEVGTLVVGMPYNMNGTRGEAAAKVERFIDELRRRLTIPIVTVDERLTSYQADLMLRQMGVSDRDRRARSDEYAATIILQDYLDGLAQSNSANQS